MKRRTQLNGPFKPIDGILSANAINLALCDLGERNIEKFCCIMGQFGIGDGQVIFANTIDADALILTGIDRIAVGVNISGNSAAEISRAACSQRMDSPRFGGKPAPHKSIGKNCIYQTTWIKSPGTPCNGISTGFQIPLNPTGKFVDVGQGVRNLAGT